MQRIITCDAKTGIKFIILALILAVFTVLSSYSTAASFSLTGSKGCKVLIVILKDKENQVSDETMIKQALDKGGFITLDVEIARKLDKEFDQKYTATGSDDKFLVTPAILNFVGGQGWNLLQMQPLGQQFIFVKDR